MTWIALDEACVFAVIVISIAASRNPALRLSWTFHAFGACYYGSTAMIGIFCFRDPLLLVCLRAAVAATQGWLAWQQRPPRKRRPSKALGRVRDLGHRLVVAS